MSSPLQNILELIEAAVEPGQVCDICGWDRPMLGKCHELDEPHCKTCHDLLHTDNRSDRANLGE